MSTIEMKSNTLSKMVIGLSITISSIILLFFFALEFGIQNISLEKIFIALFSGSIGVIVGLFVTKIMKE
jgi:hypothetical protein